MNNPLNGNFKFVLGTVALITTIVGVVLAFSRTEHQATDNKDAIAVNTTAIGQELRPAIGSLTVKGAELARDTEYLADDINGLEEDVSKLSMKMDNMRTHQDTQHRELLDRLPVQ